MKKKFILSIDLGTTGNRVFCIDEEGRPISHAYREFTQYFPKPGWVEHDPLEIWDSVKQLIPGAMAAGGLSGSDALAIGMANQRETSLLWDRISGKPVYNAIVWQCRRTSEICASLKNKGHEKIFRERTGLVLDPYFSGTKVKWLLDNVPGARELSSGGRLCFGTIDTWILWNLTGGRSHKTDFTNASRTLMFDIREKKWSRELLDILDIPVNILPSVHGSSDDFGTTRDVPGLPDGIIIGGIAGDQQAAMAGQGCVFESTSKNTYGTGCFLLQNTGGTFALSAKGLITTLTCGNSGEPLYALEGSVFIGGAVIQWLRDYMKFFVSSDETAVMAGEAGSGDEVVFVPAFVGLGAPYWEMDIRGSISGITRDTTRGQIVRAALKSIALQSRDVIKSLEHDSGSPVKELKADGGASKNHFLMQYQADILNIPVKVPEIIETTALGAAYLAGITVRIYGKIDEVAGKNREASIYYPDMDSFRRDREIFLWEDAVKRLILKF